MDNKMDIKAANINYLIEKLVNEVSENINTVDECRSFITSFMYGHFKESKDGKIDIDEFTKYLEVRLQKYKDEKFKKSA